VTRTETAHWEQVFSRRPAHELSWWQVDPEPSLRLIRTHAGSAPRSVVDVGAGMGPLVDRLLVEGVAAVTLVDLAASALASVRTRLGDDARRVTFVIGDLLDGVTGSGHDVWHDRAVLHFLTDADDRAAYMRVAAGALRPGGHAVIGGFGPEGPTQCSDLPVVRASADDVAALAAPWFDLVDTEEHDHVTPAGARQSFVWTVLVRTDVPVSP